MNNEPQIRLVTEPNLLAEAFGWQNDAPRWFQDSQSAEEETTEDFLATADAKLFYGLFTDSFTALFRFNPCADRVFSVDLFARRSTDVETLTRAALSIKTFLYDKGVANGFFGWVCSKNRGVLKLYKELGFTEEKIVCYRGRVLGRPAKWILMTSNKEA